MSEELLCTMSGQYLVHSCSIVAFKVLIRVWGLTFIGVVIAYNYTEPCLLKALWWHVIPSRVLMLAGEVPCGVLWHSSLSSLGVCPKCASVQWEQQCKWGWKCEHIFHVACHWDYILLQKWTRHDMTGTCMQERTWLQPCTVCMVIKILMQKSIQSPLTGSNSSDWTQKKLSILIPTWALVAVIMWQACKGSVTPYPRCRALQLFDIFPSFQMWREGYVD